MSFHINAASSSSRPKKAAPTASSVTTRLQTKAKKAEESWRKDANSESIEVTNNGPTVTIAGLPTIVPSPDAPTLTTNTSRPLHPAGGADTTIGPFTGQPQEAALGNQTATSAVNQLRINPAGLPGVEDARVTRPGIQTPFGVHIGNHTATPAVLPPRPNPVGLTAAEDVRVSRPNISPSAGNPNQPTHNRPLHSVTTTPIVPTSVTRNPVNPANDNIVQTILSHLDTRLDTFQTQISRLQATNAETHEFVVDSNHRAEVSERQLFELRDEMDDKLEALERRAKGKRRASSVTSRIDNSTRSELSYVTDPVPVANKITQSSILEVPAARSQNPLLAGFRLNTSTPRAEAIAHQAHNSRFEGRRVSMSISNMMRQKQYPDSYRDNSSAQYRTAPDLQRSHTRDRDTDQRELPGSSSIRDRPPHMGFNPQPSSGSDNGSDADTPPVPSGRGRRDRNDSSSETPRRQRNTPNRRGRGNNRGNQNPPGGGYPDHDSDGGDAEIISNNGPIRNPSRTPFADGLPIGTLNYQQRLINNIRHLIHQMVGQKLPYPADFKGLKTVVPTSYDGSDDIETFDNWLRSVLRYYQLSKMCGPDYDALRSTTTGQYLQDVAAMWYRNSCESLIGHQWTFEEVIVGLFERFIHASSAQKATQLYEAVTYSRKDKVQSYWMQLQMKASRLIVEPDVYSFKCRFIEGLPYEIRKTLIQHKNKSAEHCTIDELVATVALIEESAEMFELHSKDSTRKTNTATTSRDTTNKPRFESNNRRDDRKSKGFRDRRDQASPYQGNNRDGRRTDTNPPPRDNARKPEPDLSRITCFACGEKGHYASDSKCTQFGKGPSQGGVRAQLRAVRTITKDDEYDDERVAAKADSDIDDNESFDGSQYESDSNAESSESSAGIKKPRDNSDDTIYNRAVRVQTMTDCDSSDEEENLQYLRSARTKALELVRPNPSRSYIRDKEPRPSRPKGLEASLTAWITVNGVEALTLFDSGSSSDSLAPDFVRVADIKAFELTEPIPLQLGVTGSRSSINYGCRPSVDIASVNEARWYFDVINIDRYDCVVGTVFMRSQLVKLDFTNDTININGRVVKALKPAEEAAILKGRRQVELDERGISGH